ncbi:hypothetical protein P261_01652 [Lachnospiraceae bacterium TWA4]|nr:hypothetical protein P261_01652 [Lachnospiraceae bacterium TWA4]
MVHYQASIGFIYMMLASMLLIIFDFRLNTIALCFASMVFFLAYLIIYPKVYPNANQQIITNAVFLLSIGLMMIARLDTKKVNKAWMQLFLIIVAAVISFIVPYILSNGKKYLYKGTWLYGIFGVLALLAPLLFGKLENGAKLAIKIGGFSLQFSEIVKITLVFFVAGMFQKKLFTSTNYCDNRSCCFTCTNFSHE